MGEIPIPPLKLIDPQDGSSRRGGHERGERSDELIAASIGGALVRVEATASDRTGSRPGTTKASRAKENAASADLELDAAELRQIGDALAEITIVGERYPAHLAARRKVTMPWPSAPKPSAIATRSSRTTRRR